MTQKKTFEDLFPVHETAKDFNELNHIIVGGTKAGKTTMSQYLSKSDKPCYHIMTEDGLRFLAHKDKVLDANGLDRLLTLKLEPNKAMMKEKFSRIIVDLASDIATMVGQKVLSDMGIKKFGDAEWSADYTMLKNEWFKLINRIFALNLPVTFILHLKEVTETTGKGQMKTTTTYYKPNMTGSTWEYIDGKVDCVAFIMNGPKGSYLTFKPSNTVQAGSRYPWLFSQDFKMDHSNLQNTVKEIREVFEKGAKEHEASGA